MSTTRCVIGPRGHFLFGNVRAISDDRLAFFNRMRREYGDFVEIPFLLGHHSYLLNDPELVKFVLVDHPEYFQKTPNFKAVTRSTIGEGLLTSEGELHKRQRRLVQPAFHHQRINSYGVLMVDETLAMLSHWQNGQNLDVHEEIMRLTMNIVARALFSADVSADAGRLGEAISTALKETGQRVTRLFLIPEWVPTPANLERRKIVKLLLTTIGEIIEARRRSGEDRGDLLSMLLLAQDEDGSRMSDKQVRDEALTLFIAGHETTANALSWTFYLLAQHPQVEARLHTELDDVLMGRVPQTEDAAHLPYTRMIIKESMRLYPPAWIVPRAAVRSFELAGKTIKAGSIIFASPYTMHRHPRYFASTEAFVPERWTDEFEKQLPKYAYFPFGGGPRVCIGNGFALLEAQLVLAAIAQRWQLRLLPHQSIVPEAGITLRPRDGIHMQTSARVVERQPEAVR
jgi:cytochrome P450